MTTQEKDIKSEMKSRLMFSDEPIKYNLMPFSPTEFGTEAELHKKRRWHARYNLAKAIQREADIEFEKRKGEVAEWYKCAVVGNVEKLLTAVGEGSLMARDCRYSARGFDKFYDTEKNILSIIHVKDTGLSLTFERGVKLGGYSSAARKYLCHVTGSQASFLALFKPKTPEALAALAGCDVAELPDVLQYWFKEELYAGNCILDNLDPLEWVLKNRWRELLFLVSLYLSKRAINKVRKEHERKTSKIRSGKSINSGEASQNN